MIAAKTSAEVLEARDYARVAYDAAKSAGRMAKAKKAHEDVMGAVYRAQADALLIEARAKIRLADEYDAAQERGEVAKGSVRTDIVAADNDVRPATASEIGLRRDEIHEARKFRDSEAADPGKTERTLNEIVARGEEPTKAKLRAEISGNKSPANDPEPIDPLEAKLLKDFENLTEDGWADTYVGLMIANQELRFENENLRHEVSKLKSQIKEFEGDQAETIRRQANTIRHKESEMFRANDKADKALARAKHLERELNELKKLGVAV